MDEELVDPEEAARRRKSALLLIAGACSLALPLMGVGILRWREAAGPPRQAASAAVFQPRDGTRRVTLPPAPAIAASVALGTVAPAPLSSPAGSAGAAGPGMSGPSGPLAVAPSAAPGPATGSLGFIKPSGDYFKEKPAPRPAPRQEEAAPAASSQPEEAPRAASKRSKAKGGKKPFVMPKLNPAKGFTSFKNRRQPEPQPEAEGGDMSEMLKNLPPGAANNPELQKYLQGR